jgi:dihydropteroate synthase
MGIVNVTPDSFSDGGRHDDPDAALAHGRRLVRDGADLLDVGAESTRPGAEAVAPADEQERLLPVVRALAAEGLPLSVDTRNATTAAAALACGADLVNDVSMLRHDPELAAAVADAGAGLVLMHSRGTPADMDACTDYEDVVEDVAAELRAARDRALSAGVSGERLVLDPGLGFAKSREQDLEILRRLGELRQRLDGARLLVGASRKRLVGHLLARDGRPRAVDRRDAGSVGVALAAIAAGADWVRVHDVGTTVDALAGFLAARPGGLRRGD